MDITSAIEQTYEAAKRLNSGTFYYTSGSAQVSSDCAIGYGYIQKWDMTLTGYEQDITNISVFIPRTDNSTVLRPNQIVSLVGSHISASFSVEAINNYNPVYVWLTLRGRKDSKFVPT